MAPKKKSGPEKNLVVRARVTDAQMKAFTTAADREGMDLSTFARVAMIEKSRRAGVEI
jgi:hypothetical protein